MTFAALLAAARVEAGQSQAELAANAGFAPAAISHFECGRREPSWRNLCRLVAALGCSADRLIETDQ